MDDLEDEELVKRIRTGETAPYDTLMRRHNQQLYRIARVMLRNPEEAQDVVQEAYVRAYTHLDQFAGAARFSTWLTKIAVHEALARLRNRSRIVGADPVKGAEKSSGMESLESSTPNPEVQAFEKQTLEMLEAAIEAMPDNLRSVFVMREMEEMSTAETAECLGLSDAAVKIRLHRARKLLRRDLVIGADGIRSWECTLATTTFSRPRSSSV